MGLPRWWAHGTKTLHGLSSETTIPSKIGSGLNGLRASDLMVYLWGVKEIVYPVT